MTSAFSAPALMKHRTSTRLTLGEIVARLGGELIGDASISVGQVATLEAASTDAIAFLANDKYLAQLKNTRAGAVVVGDKLRGSLETAHIVADNPYAYFARLSALFNAPAELPGGSHPSAVISPEASIGERVHVAALAVIEAGAVIGAGSVVGAGAYVGPEVRIGENCLLHPNVSIYRGCMLGNRVIVHSGAVIGADGFGIAMDGGRWIKVPQVGRVRIGDDVEVGANTTIDRGALDDTIIEDGVKLDNQIQVAHNVRIGAHTAVAACVGIAGSTRIGSYCRIGGASGIAGHLSIVDHVEISAHTLVTKSIVKPGTYTGAYPFEANRDWRRNAASLRNLGDLVGRVREIESALKMRKKGES